MEGLCGRVLQAQANDSRLIEVVRSLARPDLVSVGRHEVTAAKAIARRRNARSVYPGSRQLMKHRRVLSRQSLAIHGVGDVLDKVGDVPDPVQEWRRFCRPPVMASWLALVIERW